MSAGEVAFTLCAAFFVFVAALPYADQFARGFNDIRHALTQLVRSGSHG